MASVRNRNDVRGLVDTALQASFVAASLGIWIRRVEWAVTRLAKRRVRAIGAIDGIEEVVQEATVVVVGFGGVVIGLKKDGILGVDDGVGDLEIKIRFWTCLCDWYWSSGTIDTFKRRMGALRYIAERSQ